MLENTVDAREIGECTEMVWRRLYVTYVAVVEAVVWAVTCAGLQGNSLLVAGGVCTQVLKAAEWAIVGEVRK